MRVDPAIAAMRRDRTKLGKAQSAVFDAARRWTGDARVAPILADFAIFARGASLFDCPRLAEMFEPGEQAREFADLFVSAQCCAVAAEQFAQVPFRHAYDGRMATLMLAQHGSARLSLVSYEPGRHGGGSLVFSDSVRHEAVLAGEGRATRTLRRTDGTFVRDDLGLDADARIALDLTNHALFVHHVERRLVCLRLSRDNPDPRPTREYDPASGALRREASGSARLSRHEAMLALLGRMKRIDAAPVMAEMACEPGPDSLRWEALRECLALDTATGFAALTALARAAGDPLAHPAGALRAQLIEAHPQLLQLEDAQCRA